MLKSRLRLTIFLAVIIASLVLVPASAASNWVYVDYDVGYDTGTYDSYLFYLSPSDDSGEFIEVLCADYNTLVDPDNDIGKTYRAVKPGILGLSNDDLALLRAILLDNNPTGLEAGKVIAAKQLALWEIINHIKRVDPIPDADIADEVNRLLSLPGVPDTADIDLQEVSRTDNLDGTITMVYEITTTGGASIADFDVSTRFNKDIVSKSLDGSKLTLVLNAGIGFYVKVIGTYPDKLTLFVPETRDIQPFIGLTQGTVSKDLKDYLEPVEYGSVILRKDVDNVADDPTEFKVKFTNQESGVSVVKTIREGSDLVFNLPIGTYKVEEIDIPSSYSLVSIEPETLVVGAPMTAFIASENSDEEDDTPVVTVTNRRKPEPTSPTSSTSTSTVQYKLEISVEGSGSVLPGPGTYTHTAGTVQMISVSGDAQFLGWFGENGSEVYAVGNLYGIAINSDKKIIARFATPGEEPAPTEEPVEEPVAAGSAEEANTEISDDAVPQSAAELPKTGGLPVAILYMAGGASILSGLVPSKGKKRK